VLAEPHLLVLSLGAFAVLVASVREHRRIPFVVAIALTLGITNLIPTPSYQQYFATLVPFLVIPTVDLVASWHLSSSRVAGIALVAVVVGALVPPGIVPASTSGVVPRNGLDPSDTRAISSAIDARTDPDEVVLSLWPGFLFETHARPLPGLESDFVAKAVLDTHLSPQRARDFHMLSPQGIVGAIRAHRTRFIVVGQGDLSDTAPWRTVVEQAGYRPVARHQFATLYEYNAQSQSGR
jgi:hypothetical protein